MARTWRWWATSPGSRNSPGSSSRAAPTRAASRSRRAVSCSSRASRARAACVWCRRSLRRRCARWEAADALVVRRALVRPDHLVLRVAQARADRIGLFGAPRERGDDARVEVLAGLLEDPGQRLGVRPGLLVRPRRGQRVVDVRQRHDARRERDRVALQAGRVAAAVPLLVVAARDVAAADQEALVGELAHHALDRLRADLVVRAHDLPLLVREAPGLEQDRVGDADLADVVQRARAHQVLDEALVDHVQELAVGAQALGQELAVGRDALEVLAGLLVALLG